MSMLRRHPLRLALAVSVLAHLLVLLLLLPLRASQPLPAPLQVELLNAPGHGGGAATTARPHPSRPVVQSRTAPPGAHHPADTVSTPAPAAVIALPSAAAQAERGGARTPAPAATTQADNAGALTAPLGGSVQPASVTPARYLGDAQDPPYPESARSRGAEGRVEVQVTLASDGRVTAVKLTRSSGDEELDQAALDLLRRGTYTPAQRAGVPIASRLRMTVPFRLNH
ncbi:hypothetical protein THUN1379_17200 [Paludibacterium sp. THUN1379]|uniref:TonB family protein n=1 Tax=Paludibacterium sp. THUN1379 TaxID=3112107 RepID=UPI00308CAEB3|nr:hypothetical protein THUN1379_17200 [Paludibacterium sp. THUN1379]